MNRPLLLASQSPARTALLRAAGIPVEAIAPGVDEARIQAPHPAELARARARAKAEAVASIRPDAWVIGADQVAWLGSEVFGKPTDPEDHRRRLRSLVGRVHMLTTATCLCGPDGLSSWETNTALKFRSDLSEEEIDAYVATGEGSGCAGGYAAEGLGAQLLERVDGDWFNVLGLPVLELVTMLRQRGWRPAFSLNLVPLSSAT